MRARPVDANGDMLPVAFADDEITGAKAVAQVAKQRLQFLYGEWWEDETEGFRILPFLEATVRRDRLQMLAKYISSYIADTEGVTSVTNDKIELVGRQATYYCVLHTGDETEVLEVNLDGLLSA